MENYTNAKDTYTETVAENISYGQSVNSHDVNGHETTLNESNGSHDMSRELEEGQSKKENGTTYELSCRILSLSFLENEEDIYTEKDLKEKY